MITGSYGPALCPGSLSAAVRLAKHSSASAHASGLPLWARHGLRALGSGDKAHWCSSFCPTTVWLSQPLGHASRGRKDSPTALWALRRFCSLGPGCLKTAAPRAQKPELCWKVQIYLTRQDFAVATLHKRALRS